VNEKEKGLILGYDVDALKRNIKKREEDIKLLISLIERGAKHPEAFSAEIEKARQDIATLKSYIKMIEGEKTNEPRV